MAELAAPEQERAPVAVRPWAAAQTRAQYGVIAWLRWRILLNGFRRKGGAGELIARIIVYPIFSVMALMPTAAGFGGALWFVHQGHIERIAWLLWATFALCQLLNIQISTPGTTFDPTQLIRFPLALADYVTLRLFFGLLTPANIIGTLISLAIAAGVAVAAPGLWTYALCGLLVFAATNVLFSRMVFAWVDRWLATRRAREIFTGLIFAFSLGIQWLNVTLNPAYGHHKHGQTAAQMGAMARFYGQLRPFVRDLPPELTTASLMAARRGETAQFAWLTLGCAAFGAVFLLVFALRMRSEFRGESLSDRANGAAMRPKRSGERDARSMVRPAASPAAASQATSPVAVLFAKELLFLRRNTGVLYSVIAPLVFVLIFAGRLATRESAVWVFPAALVYTLLGTAPLSFNSFGLEGAGAQFYFFAPVRLRDVLLAKNLLNLSLAVLEMVAVYAIISYSLGPPRPEVLIGAVCWAMGTLLTTTVIGNRRSVASPKQINMARAGGKQASPLSALISMGVLLLSGVMGVGLFGVAWYLGRLWLLMPIFGVFLAIALWAYLRSLRTIDAYGMEHREELFAELCKKA